MFVKLYHQKFYRVHDRRTFHSIFTEFLKTLIKLS